MSRYQYVILSQAVEGRLEEFEKWYDEVHLRDVLKIAGVIGARRLRIVGQKTLKGMVAAPWCSLAIYEMETDDPVGVTRAIAKAAHTDAMPVSDALEQTGMIQLITESTVALWQRLSPDRSHPFYKP